MQKLKLEKGHKSVQLGFTIIELVVVILLLGILTATALPRFMDVTDSAHDSVVEAVFGGLSTGSALFHAQYIANGQPAANVAIANFGAGTMRTNATGYPVGTTSGAGVVDLAADCIEIYNELLQAGRPIMASTGVVGTSGGILSGDIAGVLGSGDFQAIHTASSNSTTCYYAYIGQYLNHSDAQAATPADLVPVIVYDTTTGTITLSDSTSF